LARHISAAIVGDQHKESVMSSFFEDEDGEYLVLINDEGQYSLWRTFKPIPPGWRAVGPQGARSECLEFINTNWTDMRPKSLIRQMELAAVERATLDDPTTAH
jgi:MbtH protein